MPQTKEISVVNSEPEKAVANNIDCPKCGSQNCFVNESDGVVEAKCLDCGMSQQELIDCPECGGVGNYPAGPSHGCEEFSERPECESCGGTGKVPPIPEGHKRIFVYGSLRKGLYNYGRCGKMTFVCNASLKGYGLFDLGAYPAIVKHHKGKHQVIGEVYDVDETTFRRLNGMEIGAGYGQIEGEVELSTGKMIPAIFWDMELKQLTRYYGEKKDRLVAHGDWVKSENERKNNKEV